VQAKKEKNDDVVSRLELVLKAAFEAKQATLRPEIQLLNRLLSQEVDTEQQRQQVSKRCGASLAAVDLRYNICSVLVAPGSYHTLSTHDVCCSC
jgi:hypothetical protein